ncbi:MAG: flippase-like domain-containing protein [Spirochaetes bacterium]|nr:flippase-like domain-containing protein [Spirochaetota bacterium]
MIPALKLQDYNRPVEAPQKRVEPERQPAAPVSEKRTILYYVKIAAPWVVGIAILAYLVWRIEFSALVNALARADVVLYAAVLAAFIILNFLVDTQNLQAILTHSRHSISFSETMMIRGASYLLMIVDYTLGMSSIAYYLKKSKGIPFIRGMGLMFVLNFTTQASLLVMALAGCLLMSGSPSHWLSKMAIGCGALLASSLIFLIGLKLLPEKSIFRKIKRNDLMKGLVESSARTYLINTLYRCGFYFTFILFFYVAVRAFNMDIPFMALIAYVPVILLIISIPISAFGLGTSQAAMLFLFRDYGTPAQILAFSLVYSASIIIVRGIIGACYYGIITKRVSYKTKILHGEVS